MEYKANKEIQILAHIYDFLNGGYFSSAWQLEYIDKEIFLLCKKKDKTNLKIKYDLFKINYPKQVISQLEKSAGIRYFLCDGCHDAQITNICEFENGIKFCLNTNQMLGGITNKIDNGNVVITLYSKDKNQFKELLFSYIPNKSYWLYDDIILLENNFKFSLEIDTCSNETMERFKATFLLDNIEISN